MTIIIYILHRASANVEDVTVAADTETVPLGKSAIVALDVQEV